jgi:ATP synthase subunit D
VSIHFLGSLTGLIGWSSCCNKRSKFACIVRSWNDGWSYWRPSAKIVSQRVNLFDRVLIPKTEANIQRKRVALSDSERASIVRAKIAKGEKGVA